MGVDSCQASIGFSFKQTAAVGPRTKTDSFKGGTNSNFSAGAGAGQVSKVYGERRTLAGASENLDLAGGIVDGLGNTHTFANVKVLYLYNPTGNDPITVGGAASNAWAALLTGTIIIPPGMEVEFKTGAADGVAVTAGTGDILKVAGTTGQSYDIGLAGE